VYRLVPVCLHKRIRRSDFSWRGGGKKGKGRTTTFKKGNGPPSSGKENVQRRIAFDASEGEKGRVQQRF